METQAEDKVSAEQSDIDKVLEKINEIARISATGDYIYRGEAKYHCKVSSNLYREYEKDIEAANFDIAIVQEEILKEAKEYATPKMDDTEILTELQHYGGKTNLIDFTTDYLVALFFACDGNPDKPGRVILLPKQSETYEVIPAPRTIPRAGIQKSIFVQSPSGIVEPDDDDVICIPPNLKKSLLEHLQKHHDISTRTIYNDLLGFIEKRKIHESGYTEFYKGFTCQGRGDSTEEPAEKQKWYDKAVVHYTTAIELNPQDVSSYVNRGNAYNDKGKFDAAIQDFNTVIQLNPEDADAYYNRGTAYYRKGEFDAALRDFNIAIALNPEDVDAYNNRGTAYYRKGEFDVALRDFNTAIALNREDADAYYNRGEVWLHLSGWEEAKADLIAAKHLGINISESFHNEYDSVEAFEATCGVELPEDLAALLRRA